MIRPACERPADSEVPLARWSSTELAAEVVARGICEQISGVTVWRRLSEDAIKPWQHRSWIFPRDPKFTANAGRILDLYSGRWDSELLHPGDYVVCCDEKPPIQARQRKHATLPAAPGIKRGQRVEHEYDRKGALCYLAAWDAKRAKLFDRCAPKDGIVPFDALVEQFMTIEPYCKAQRVFVIVDNGSAHRGQRSIDRLQGAWPNLILVHTPVPRQLAQPGRDLLLDRPTQGPDTQRLRRPRHAQATTARVRPPLRADRHAARMEIHTRRPRPPRQTTRPTRHPGRLTEYVGELPSQSTKHHDVSRAVGQHDDPRHMPSLVLNVQKLLPSYPFQKRR